MRRLIPARDYLSKFLHDARTNPYFRERMTTVATGAILNLAFLGLSRNLGVVAFIDILFFLGPVLLWRLILRVSTLRFLRTFLLDRKHARLIPRVLQRKLLPDRYFLAPIRVPSALWWRSFQLLFFVFFLSSLSVPRLPLFTSATPESEVAGFALIGILYLAVFGPLLALIWVYDDWGLRGYDNVREVVYPIGSTTLSYITGFGALGSLIKFVISLNVNPAESVAAVVFWLFILLPPCLWTVVGFHVFMERKIIRKLKESDVGQAIFMKSITID